MAVVDSPTRREDDRYWTGSRHARRRYTQFQRPPAWLRALLHFIMASHHHWTLAALLLLAPIPTTSSSPLPPLPTFSIAAYGAVGDNATLNTAAIQATIAAASAAGGGYVLVPPGGAFLTATLHLLSNVYLLVPAGATLQGSAHYANYTAVSGLNWDRWDVLHTNNASNSGIVGSLDGSMGGTLAGPMWQMIAGYNVDQNQFNPQSWTGGEAGCPGECRPRLVVFEDCANITVANVRLVDSADWTQLYRRTSNILLANVTVWGSQQWPNNDGVDFESCANVLVSNWTSFTGDDGIVFGSGNCNDMKSPWPEPIGHYTPTTNVTIDGAVISAYSSAIKWEGIFQVEHGDVTGVTVRNVLIHDSARGIGFQQRTGRGVWANVSFTNVTVLRTHGIIGGNWWGYGEAVWITSIPEGGPASNATRLGGIHNVSFNNVVSWRDSVRTEHGDGGDYGLPLSWWARRQPNIKILPSLISSFRSHALMCLYSFRPQTLEGEQGIILMYRDQGNATWGPTGPGISNILFNDAVVRVGVYGNATRPGVHDFRPVDSSTISVHANVTGYWFESVGASVVAGGSVSFVGPPQPFWQRGTCSAQTPDSSVYVEAVQCFPAR